MRVKTLVKSWSKPNKHENNIGKTRNTLGKTTAKTCKNYVWPLSHHHQPPRVSEWRRRRCSARRLGPRSHDASASWEVEMSWVFDGESMACWRLSHPSRNCHWVSLSQNMVENKELLKHVEATTQRMWWIQKHRIPLKFAKYRQGGIKNVNPLRSEL